MKLYVVTTVVSPDQTRTPVVCMRKSSAVAIVKENELDIHETWYPYAVIEEIEADEIYSPVTGEWWYHWEGHAEHGRYVQCEKPPEWKGITKWGVG